MRRHLLQHGIGGDQHDRGVRFLAVGDQSTQRRKPAGRCIGARRDAVVGKTVPGRQGENRNVGGDEAEHLFQIGHAMAVGHDIGDRLSRSGEFGKQQRFEAGRHIADRQRLGNSRKLLRIETRDHSGVLRGLSKSGL